MTDEKSKLVMSHSQNCKRRRAKKSAAASSGRRRSVKFWRGAAAAPPPKNPLNFKDLKKKKFILKKLFQKIFEERKNFLKGRKRSVKRSFLPHFWKSLKGFFSFYSFLSFLGTFSFFSGFLLGEERETFKATIGQFPGLIILKIIFWKE